MSGSAEGVSIETNLTRNAHFSEVVLKVLAKAWHSLLPASQAKVCQLLTNVTCVPSRAGNRAGMVSTPSPLSCLLPFRCTNALKINIFVSSFTPGLPWASLLPERLPLPRPRYRLPPKRKRHQGSNGTASHRFGSSPTRRSGPSLLISQYSRRQRTRLDGRRAHSVSCQCARNLDGAGEGEAEAHTRSANLSFLSLCQDPSGYAYLIRTVAIAFAVETTGQRLAPSEIYEPSEELRQLGLPILDWIGTKWKPGSNEGEVDSSSVTERLDADTHLPRISAASLRARSTAPSDDRRPSSSRICLDVHFLSQIGGPFLSRHSLLRLLLSHLPSQRVSQAAFPPVYQAGWDGFAREPAGRLLKPRVCCSRLFGCE
jgi:hypothetical protein